MRVSAGTGLENGGEEDGGETRWPGERKREIDYDRQEYREKYR